MMWQQNIEEDSIPEGLSTKEEGDLRNLMKLKAHLAAAEEEYSETYGHRADIEVSTGHNSRALPAIFVRFADFYTYMDED